MGRVGPSIRSRLLILTFVAILGVLLTAPPATASHQYTGWHYDGLYIRGQTWYHGSLVNHTVPQGRTRRCYGSSFTSWYVSYTSLWNAWQGTRVWYEGMGPSWSECEWRGNARMVDRHVSYPEMRQLNIYRHVDGWNIDETLRYWW